MAKLRVSADLIVKKMFDDEMVTITGCRFDPRLQHVVFDIQGSAVPDVEEVVAELTIERRTITFKPREMSTAA